MADQIPFSASTADPLPFGTDNFAENPEPRCPCILVLDTSVSMQGEPLRQLNEGLAAYKQDLMSDSLAQKRVEVAIVTFGPVDVAVDFVTAEHFQPPVLTTTGDTPMGAALNKAVDMVTARKQVYRANGIGFFRPWLFLITDGAPTDAWASAAARVREGEANKAFSFFGIGVEGADFGVMKQISTREPLRLKGLSFREFFRWLSNSQQSVSKSQPGEAVKLPPTGGWSEVEV